jgi:tetratricopeptide (TPR) repeat protein
MLLDRRGAHTVRASLAQGRLDEAGRALERWLNSRPQAPEAHYLKARLAWARSDLSTVQKELFTARRLGYSSAELASLRGLILARGNQTEAAEPLLRQAASTRGRIDPDIAETLTYIYLSTFRLNRAAELLDRWMQDWPADARPHFLRTEIDTRTGVSTDVIVGRYHAALMRDPNYDQARLRLADALRIAHRTNEAVEEYALYVKRNSQDPLGYLGAGQTALQQGNLPEAARQLDQALALSPSDPVVLGARATVYLRQGHLDTALATLDRAVKLDPFDSSNRYQRMLILFRQGRREAAESEQLQLEQIHKDESAFGEISLLLERNPLDVQLQSKAAQWLMDHGHEAEALDWAKLVLRTTPSHPQMNRLLAIFYRRKGNPGLANLYEAHSGTELNRDPPHR